MNTDGNPTAADDGPSGDEADAFQTPGDATDDLGLSLEDLAGAYAQLLGKERNSNRPVVEQRPLDQGRLSADDVQTPLDPIASKAEPADADAAGEISPRTLIEAMLFVGHPNNEPIAAVQLAALMRGVEPDEVGEIVRELNEAYRAEGCPYYIASEGAGYRMTLRDEFQGLREKFYGRIKETRLSQAAIDVLALVAFNQPLPRAEIDRLRDKDNAAVLSQLVRRRLLSVERRADDPRVIIYRTTDRFLQLFGLQSLDDLPRTQDLERP